MHTHNRKNVNFFLTSCIWLKDLYILTISFLKVHTGGNLYFKYLIDQDKKNLKTKRKPKPPFKVLIKSYQTA